MFERKLKIAFAIAGIATVIGFISGVAPGFYIPNYGLFGIGLGFLLILFILVIGTTIILQYQSKDQVLSVYSTVPYIFDRRLLCCDIVLLNCTNAFLLIAGTFLGGLFELLLTSLNASIILHIIVAAVFIFVLLVLFIIILIAEIQCNKTSKSEVIQRRPISVEDISMPVENVPISVESYRKPKSTKSQNGPQNTALRINRYHPRIYDDKMKSTWLTPSYNDPLVSQSNNYTQPMSTIQKEYQKLLHASPHYYIGDKVFVNDRQMAQIIAIEGTDLYRIQYLDTGLIDFRNGSELRRALPLIS